MNYFERTYQTAKRNSEDYDKGNEFQMRNIGFCAAGNLSRATSNRFSRMKRVSHDKGMKTIYRRMMLNIYNELPFFTQSEFEIDGRIITSLDAIKWEKLNEIISECNQWKYYTDEYPYWEASFSGAVPLVKKLDAIKAFINRYGSSTDKRILIPQLTIN